MDSTDIVELAKQELKKLMVENNIADHHGYQHMIAVHNHAKSALEDELLLEENELAIELAALLHDVDDKKIFKNSQNNENARKILDKVLPLEYKNDKFIELVIGMIELVSCSKNGSSKPRKSWMAIPRDADRLEALGSIGIQRCKEFNLSIGAPLHLDSTPRVHTEEELWKVATPERFANYKSSDSMIDHFYDKLLHIGKPEYLMSCNSYILEEAAKRNQCMIQFVLQYWKDHE